MNVVTPIEVKNPKLFTGQMNIMYLLSNDQYKV